MYSVESESATDNNMDTNTYISGQLGKINAGKHVILIFTTYILRLRGTTYGEMKEKGFAKQEMSALNKSLLLMSDKIRYLSKNLSVKFSKCAINRSPQICIETVHMIQFLHLFWRLLLHS